MRKLVHKVSHVLTDARGQGMVEYALIIFLVAVALVGALQLLTGAVGQVFSNITGSL